MVFYRKYRPQTINELDSSSLRETLSAVLKTSEQHAFLFTGPKGLGKTSTARIIAKVVNCERLASSKSGSSEKNKKLNAKRYTLDASIEPCNKCEQCISTTNGTNLDVLEIDAASNRGIDEIRDLREKIRLAPLSAKKKIYIIDEVHMLTTEAFNALLKTLEEPPDHAIFMLCTTEPQKVPSTIISRCFHIAFHPATESELIRSFERIVKGEKIDIDKEALKVIAKLSEGGFRDGTKVLEELVALSQGKKITPDFVEEKFRVAGTYQSVDTLITALGKRDAKQALSVVSASVADGQDPKLLLSGVIEKLHAALLVKAGAIESSKLKVQTSKLDIAELKELLELLLKAQGMSKTAVLAQLPLELAIVEWCLGESAKTQKANPMQPGLHRDQSELIVSKEEKKEEKAVETKSADDGNGADSYFAKEENLSLATVRRQVGNLAKIKALYGDQVVKDDEVKDVDPPLDISLLHFSSEGEITKEWINVFWRSVILQMKSHNHTIAGVLRGCSVKSFDRKTLIIETAYKFHKERLGDMRTKTALENVCKELTGKVIAVSIELKAN